VPDVPFETLKERVMLTPRLSFSCAFSWLAASACAALLASCGGGGSNSSMAGSTGTSYVATSVVSDVNTSGNPYNASNVDAKLVNAWGIAFNPAGFAWVADNGTSMSTLYDGNGVPQSLVVSIPAGAAGAASPTGIVFNGLGGFQVSQGGTSGSSAFIFAGEAGTIAGWSPNVNLNSAVTVFDGATASKVYKGLALASQGSANFLYATDFHNGVVDMFDSAFQPVASSTAFKDPTLPAGYAPFGIQAIANQIYVSYAMQDTAARDNLSGAGLGLVDVFDASGALVRRLIAPGGKLNAPWGIAMAPANFGKFSGDLLVGNFGDGTINAFDPSNGTYRGRLSKADGTALVIDGLWAIAFGNGINAQPTNTLFYAAGPTDETHGVYGRIDSN
jgi:uncharacterized protein (TIGR03118 family)